MAKRKLTKADRDAREQMVRNAEHTRQLALKIQAELEQRKPPEQRAR